MKYCIYLLVNKCSFIFFLITTMFFNSFQHIFMIVIKLDIKLLDLIIILCLNIQMHKLKLLTLIEYEF